MHILHSKYWYSIWFNERQIFKRLENVIYLIWLQEMLFQFARLSVKTLDIFHIKYILHKFKFNNVSRVITGIIIFHSNDGMLSYPPFSINAEQGALSGLSLYHSLGQQFLFHPTSS